MARYVVVTDAPSPADRPRRAWLVINPAAHSFTDALHADICETAADRGLTIAGTTRFPEDDLPDRTALEHQKIDTVILFGGDGTINAMACHVAKWPGAFLVLPGGTMNMLPRRLHGDASPKEIIERVCDAPAALHLPFVEAGAHRSFVRLLAGPAASFVHVREAARDGRLRRLWRALVFAWRLSRSRRIGMTGTRYGFRLVVAHAVHERLHLAGIRVRTLLGSGFIN